ncbi:hypothetical protein O988_04457 [Pseudogymnoascus sp. VKM F-3808]|nr:hypothetical protein O988_04457 [Pseudogymnoascus sp. VKM F-3808]
MISANSPPLSAQPISLRAIVFVLCLLLSQVSPAQSAVCYDSSGLASGPESKKPFFPCESDAGVTSCCEPGDICFSNGLCSPGPALKASHEPGFYQTSFFWNACTDPSFQDPKCFTGCFSVPGNGVQSCPEAGPNAYCCYGYGGCDCSDPSQIIHVVAGSIIGTIDLDVKFPSSALPSTPTPSSEPSIHTTPSTPGTHAAPSESSTHASPSASSTDATSSTSASKEAPETTTSPETSTPTNTPSKAEESTPSSTPVPKDKDATETSTSPEPITSTNPPTQAQENKSLAIPIGVGVGVSGAILIAIIVIAIIFLRRRKQKAVPYWEPPLTYETKPYEAHSDDAYPNEAPSDEAYHEMITRYNTTELSSVTPAQRYRELHSPGLHPPGLHSPT